MPRTLTLSGTDRPERRTVATPAPADKTEHLRQHVAQLSDKLAGQPVIEQAKGMLMQTFGLSADDAFELLRVLSRNGNVRLRWIARCIVESWTRCGPRADFDAASDSCWRCVTDFGHRRTARQWRSNHRAGVSVC